MLMRRRVENDLRAVFFKDLVEALPVTDGRDLDGKREIVTVAVEQVVLQLIGGIFRDVEQHEPRGPVACDLAAQL